MKFKKITTAILTVALAATAVSGACLLSACGGGDEYSDHLMLHLAFDEGKGNTVKDSSKNLEDAEVEYVYTDAQYKESRDPEWCEKGVEGGSLLFDGYSNRVRYSYDEIAVKNSSFTVSAYVAPRVFEWDDPNAKENGTPHLTSIVSQCYIPDGEELRDGFVLGYWRYGELCFQVGTNDFTYTLWSGDKKLDKYEWNYVVGEFDGENKKVRLFLNGELVEEQDIVDEVPKITPAVDESLCIGCHNYPTGDTTANYNMVSGLLDEVKLYDTAVSAEYVKSTFEKNGRPEIAFEDIWHQNILTDDIYKTQYHGGPYQMWMNEPHAPMYYNGVYHLFFQFNLTGPYWHQICWGHFTSTDMVNWTPRKEVITPTEGSVCPDGVWSGGATLDKNGVPVLFFTAGNDSWQKEQGLISNQNIGYAVPKDLSDPYLTEWTVGDELAIKQQAGQGKAGDFRDAHIWKEDGTWYMLVCSGVTGGGTALLFYTDTLEANLETGTVDMDWKFKSNLYTIPNQNPNLGLTWELPTMLPIQNAAKTITKYLFLISPAPADKADNNIYYFLGSFNKTTGKFIPDAGYETPKRMDYGTNIFTGPSAFINPADNQMYMFSVMQDKRSASEVASAGWACCVGLARKVWLNDDGTDIKMDIVSAVKEDYATSVLSESGELTLEAANQKLAAIDPTSMCYVKVTFKNEGATSFGVTVKSDGKDGTMFTYDAQKKTITGAPYRGGATLTNTVGSGALDAGDTLTMEFYIDRSLVEAFFNNDRAISTRSYSDFDATKILLFANGGTVKITNLQVSTVRSIYE